MTSLAVQQQLLLDALLDWPPENAMKMLATHAVDMRARGVKAYQTNGHMLAQRALQAAYPVVAQLLGEESFFDLARALWHAHPPVCGDVALWGASLADFLRSSAQLQDEPYLADVARAEWALHRCASAPDVDPVLASLALLTTHEPSDLSLVLAPGSAVVRSAWPVASVLGAHLEKVPTLAEAGAQLRAAVAQDAVVWRAGLRPRVRLAMAGEADLLQALLQGDSLAQALDKAPSLDFAPWLAQAVQSALLLAVAPHCPVTPTNKDETT